MKKMKLLFLLFLFPLILNLQSCLDLPGDILMPQWNVNLNLPITKKSYELKDIFKGNGYIKIDDENNFVITSDTYSQDTDITSFIELNAESKTENNNVSVANTAGDETYLEFPEGTKLQSADFSKGILKFSSRNLSLIAPITLIFDIPGFLNPAFQPLQVVVIIPPAGQRDTIIDLKNHYYREPQNQHSFFKGQLWIKARAQSIDPIATALYDAYNSDFLFTKATGYLPRKSLGVKQNQFNLNLGDAIDYRGKVILAGATLELKASYISPENNPFPVLIKDLTITGKRSNGTTFSMMVKDSLSGIFTDKLNLKFSEDDVSLRFTELNSNVTEFLTFLPDEILLEAEYIMNPDQSQSYYTATDADKVYFETYFTSKRMSTSEFLASIEASSVTDTVDLNFSEDDKKSIENGRKASITIDVENNIALNTWMKLIIADENKNPLFTLRDLTTNADSLKFKGANVNSSGIITSPSSSKLIVELNESEIQKLAKGFYAFVVISVETSSFNNSNPLPVLLKSTDWIKINAYGQVDYNINLEDNN
jgi:hypothetical protein